MDDNTKIYLGEKAAEMIAHGVDEEIKKRATNNADVVSALEQAIGSKANQNEFDSHVGNDTIHITSSERNKWNSAISGTDDTKDNIVSFTNNDTTNPTSWSDVSALTSGEKHTSIFTKISTMFKNIRYLYKLIGTTDISAIGNGTVTGGLSALNSNFNNYEIKILTSTETTSNVGTFSFNYTNELPNGGTLLLAYTANSNYWCKLYGFSNGNCVLGIADLNNQNSANIQHTVYSYWLVKKNS